MGSSGSCAGCGDEINLVHARPVVGGDGRVALWCRGCWPKRDAIACASAPAGASAATSLVGGVAARPSQPRRPRSVSAIELPEPPPARRRRTAVAIAAGFTLTAAAAVAVIGTASSGASSPRMTVAASMAPASKPAAAVAKPAPPPRVPGDPADSAAPPAEPAVAADDADDEDLLTDEGTADPEMVETQTAAIDLATLEEERPTLLDWIHPVTGTDELIPQRGTRKFGARREGASRTSCGGGGHCGVDLSGPRGRPVVAVAWGTVARVEHSAQGRDGRSGRYVRLAHPEGVFTSYMHLDAIEADIQVGDEVEAGTVLGTLGKTAIRHGEQHLHFGLEIEERGALIYVDPTPFLARAQVMPVPDRPLNLLPPAERAQW